MKPIVSVLIPCYNAEKYLEEALQSIVTQSYRQLEIILVDDGSTDGSETIYRRFSQKDERIHIVKNEQNLGLIKTLNKGIQLAKGDYLARMDADDISHADRIQTQVDFLQSNPDIDIVGTAALPIDLEGNLKAGKKNYTYVSPNTLAFSSFFTQPFFHGSILAKTTILKQHPYSLEYPHSEDFELWLRLSNQGYRFSNLEETLYHYRVNPEGVSISNEETQKESHNKASAFYLELKEGTPLNSALTALLNNRPSNSVKAKLLKQTLRFFHQFAAKFSAEKELKEYINRQKVDICIQAFKNAESFKDKIEILSVFLIYCFNLSTVIHLLRK